MTLASRHVSECVRALRTEYLTDGLAPSYFEINNGLCEDFAEEVVRRLGAEHGAVPSLFSLGGEQLWKTDDSEDWDDALLSGYWRISPPEHFTWAMLNEVGFGGHVWVTFERRHYDAECPDGVDSLFELPLFRRYIVCYLRERGIDCPEVETDDVIAPPRCPVQLAPV